MSPPDPPAPPSLDVEKFGTDEELLTELTHLAMGLARDAAVQARKQLQNPPDPTPRGAANPPDYHQKFINCANLVRALIEMKQRAAAERAAAPRGAAAPLTIRPADPRRDKILPFVDKAIKNSPDRAILRRGVAQHLDELLAVEGSQTLPLGEILFRLCNRFGLPFDVKKLPDEFLIAPPEPDPQPPQ